MQLRNFIEGLRHEMQEVRMTALRDIVDTFFAALPETSDLPIERRNRIAKALCDAIEYVNIDQLVEDLKRKKRPAKHEAGRGGEVTDEQ